eukprot:COSAG01_NODE_1158_length_11469_cov_101.645646_12_plen_157_part_00
MEWLGFILDFNTGRIHISKKRAGDILHDIHSIRTADNKQQKITMRQLAKVVGKLMSCSRALQVASPPGARGVLRSTRVGSFRGCASFVPAGAPPPSPHVPVPVLDTAPSMNDRRPASAPPTDDDVGKWSSVAAVAYIPDPYARQLLVAGARSCVQF